MILTEERFMTLHPQGKAGVNVVKRKYQIIRDFILLTLKNEKKISFQELTKMAVKDLTDSFDGKVVWYMVTVKLDLEARGIIERIPKKSPHELRMKQ